MGKLLEELILQRLQALLVGENGLSENQFAFRKGRSTVDAIQAVVNIATNARKGTGKRNLAQALSGHGYFNAYLKRFEKRDEEMCYYCDSLVDNAEHALFFCAKWGAARKALGQAVGAEHPDTMVSQMLQSERFWTLIESFVTLLMRTRELDERREGNNEEGQ